MSYHASHNDGGHLRGTSIATPTNKTTGMNKSRRGVRQLRWSPYERTQAIKHMVDVREKGRLTGPNQFHEVVRRLKINDGFKRSASALAIIWYRNGLSTHATKEVQRRTRLAIEEKALAVPSDALATFREDRTANRHPFPVLRRESTTASFTPKCRDVVFIFKQESGEDRQRTFDKCDTAQKLFAQAIAGGLLGQANSIRVLVTKVLTHVHMVANDDEENFAQLVNLIRHSSHQASKSGSLRVEIRAFEWSEELTVKMEDC